MACALLLLKAWRYGVEYPECRRRSAVERRHEAGLPVACRPLHALLPAAAVASLPPVGELDLAKLMNVLRSDVFAQWAAPRLRSLLLGLGGCALGGGLTTLAVAAPHLAHFVRPLAELCGVVGAALFVPRLLLCLSEAVREDWLAESLGSDHGWLSGPMGGDASWVGSVLLLFTGFWVACRGGDYKSKYDGGGDALASAIELTAAYLLTYLGAAGLAMLELLVKREPPTAVAASGAAHTSTLASPPPSPPAAADAAAADASTADAAGDDDDAPASASASASADANADAAADADADADVSGAQAKAVHRALSRRLTQSLAAAAAAALPQAPSFEDAYAVLPA